MFVSMVRVLRYSRLSFVNKRGFILIDQDEKVPPIVCAILSLISQQSCCKLLLSCIDVIAEENKVEPVHYEREI